MEIEKVSAGSALTTKQTFSAAWNHYSSLQLRTVSECILSSAPTVGAVIRSHGIEMIRASVEGCIVSLCEFLNIPRANMTESQIRQTAELSVDEYRNLTISDIMLIFRRAKLGQWGEIYGRIDGQMILGWFSEYFEERCEEAARLSQSEAHRIKGEYNGSVPDIVHRMARSHKAELSGAHYSDDNRTPGEKEFRDDPYLNGEK